MGVVKRRQLKRSSLARGRWLKRSSVFCKKKLGDTVSCRPGWHQTLVTILPYDLYLYLYWSTQYRAWEKLCHISAYRHTGSRIHELPLRSRNERWASRDRTRCRRERAATNHRDSRWRRANTHRRTRPSRNCTSVRQRAPPALCRVRRRRPGRLCGSTSVCNDSRCRVGTVTGNSRNWCNRCSHQLAVCAIFVREYCVRRCPHAGDRLFTHR